MREPRRYRLNHYPRAAFRQPLAERTQDVLDEADFGLKPAKASGSTMSNLGRAAGGVAGRVRELGNLMSDVDGLFQDVAAIKPPVGAPAELREALDCARDALLDAELYLADMYEDEAKDVWSALPLDGRVRRLRAIDEEIRSRRAKGGQSAAVIDGIWLLWRRVSLDHDAARLAGLSSESLRKDLASIRAGRNLDE